MAEFSLLIRDRVGREELNIQFGIEQGTAPNTACSLRRFKQVLSFYDYDKK